MTRSPLVVSHPVQWAEGMLLSPQHFQQNDCYWEQRLCAVMSLVQPHYYGITQLDVNEGNLNSGELVINRVSGVFPDGLVFEYPMADCAEALTIDLADAFKSREITSNTLSIYLRVAKRGASAANAKSPQQRFDSIEGAKVVDENTGTDGVAVSRLVPKLSLHPATPNSNYSYFKLLEINRQSDGLFCLGNYYPPMLDINALNSLGDLCLHKRINDLRTNIRTRASRLSRALQGDAKPSPLRNRYSTFVKNLVKILPTLDIYCETNAIHPFTLYSALANFLGQIAAINPKGLIPAPLEGYQHDNSYRAFQRVIEAINTTARSVKLAYESFSFSIDNDGLFFITIDEQWRGRDLYIEFTAAESTARATLEQWVETSLIGTQVTLPTLARARFPGAQREIVEAVPTIDLSKGDHSVLIKISNQTIKIDQQPLDTIVFGERLYIQAGSDEVAPHSATLHVANVSQPSKGDRKGR